MEKTIYLQMEKGVLDATLRGNEALKVRHNIPACQNIMRSQRKERPKFTAFLSVSIGRTPMISLYL